MTSSPRYELRDRIRLTHFGAFFDGFDKQAAREVQIAELREAFTSNYAEWDAIWQQVQKLKSADLDNSVRILDTDETRRWVITEKLDGHLGQKLRNGPLPGNLVRSVLLQGLIALQSLHLHKIVHGDLRPESFVYQIGGMPNLTFSPGLVLAGKIPRRDAGLKYAAPEFFKKAFGEVGPHSDLYQLGFSALEMLIGPEFDQLFPSVVNATGDPETAWLTWHASEQVLPPVQQISPEVPDDLATVLDRLLKKNVSERYKSADEALGGLRESTIEFIPIEGDSAIKPLSKLKSGRNLLELPEESPFADAPASRPASPLSLMSANEPVAPVLAKTRRYEKPEPPPVNSPPLPATDVTASSRPAIGVPNPNPIPPRPQRAGGVEAGMRYNKKKRSNLPVILTFCVIGLLIGIGLYFWSPFGHSAEQVKLRVTSEPPGAAIFVDGTDRKAKTPAEIELAAGDYVLGIQLEGYESGSRNITVGKEKDSPGPLAFVLKKSNGTIPPDTRPPVNTPAKPETPVKPEVPAVASIKPTPPVSNPENPPKVPDGPSTGTTSHPPETGTSTVTPPVKPPVTPPVEPKPAVPVYKLPEGLTAVAGTKLDPILKLPERAVVASTAGAPDEIVLALVRPQEVAFGVRVERVTYRGELAQSKLEVKQPYYIGLTEVTNGQYGAFARVAGEETAGTAWSAAAAALGDEGARHPVVLVSIDQAKRFAGWVHPDGRLPSEVEWELAATSGQERNFPWDGNTSPTPEKSNLLFNIDQPGRTQPVDSLPKGETPWGLRHMLGNVYEWCGDLYVLGYEEDGDDPGVLQFHVIRGGSFKTRAKDDARLTMRANLRPEGSDDVGFRIVIPVSGK